MASLVHPKSCESADSGLDLFAIPPTQTAIEDGTFVEYHPLSTLALNAPIEFYISGGTGDYMDLSNTLLHVRAKVTKLDGTNLDDPTNVAPINNWLHSLFSQVDVSLNNVLISPSENTYPFRAYIETLLNYGSEAKQTYLTSSCFYPDTPGRMNDTNGDNNTGLKTRRDLAAASAEMDMMGRLHTSITNQDRYLINGVDVKITLSPTKSAFNLMATAGGEGHPFKTVITHASLFVRKVRPNPAVALAHEKALERGTCKYPMKKVNIKSFVVPRGNLSTVQDNLFLSQMPTKLIIALVDTEGFNGILTKNPFNFHHYNLNFLCLYLDGKQIPWKALTPDFEHGQYVRAFHSMMLASGMVHRDAGNGISYGDYARGFTLFAFDLSPSLLDGNQFELVKTGALRLEMKFSEALPHSVHVLVYGELDQMVEIDRARQILKD
eukprot:TRINITY_DN24483_c1_g2_i1.p1 TRINITY_DN24483_c1_g2~~TRINITY_DN24483_c1_g2_i1.p1  ORF type:complete len:437 (+),score=66.11 TRINITY_DN24483_c1_g2_i1:2267-3577(+)